LEPVIIGEDYTELSAVKGKTHHRDTESQRRIETHDWDVRSGPDFLGDSVRLWQVTLV